MGKFFLLMFIPVLTYAESFNSISDKNFYPTDDSDRVNIAFSYTSFYFLKEIQDYKITYISPFRGCKAGAEYEFFGGKLYNENILNAIYMRNMDRVLMGVKVGLDLVSIFNENLSVGYKLNLFTNVTINDSLAYALCFSDIQNLFYNRTYSMCGKIIYDNGFFNLFGEIEYKSDENLGIGIYSGYHLGDKMSFYFGYETISGQFVTGVSFNQDKITFVNEARFQHELGIKEQFSIIYGFGKHINVAPKQSEKYDLNKITFQQLIKLGIASDVACAIIDYREKIGQYFDLRDLINVYNIGDKWIEKHSKLLKVQWEKMDINQVNLSRLKTTPGVNLLLLKRIVKYRETHIIRDLDELKGIKGMNKKALIILKKYYKCEV